MRDWENIYRTLGEVQSDILPTAREAAAAFKEAGCGTILDLCCGTGRHTLFLAETGFTVHGTDLSESAIRLLSEAARPHDRVTLSVDDMHALSLPDRSFDGVLCLWSTGHGLREQVRKSVQEMRRVLKPGGLLFCDFVSTDDAHCGVGREIEPDTFLDNMVNEEDVPHHYSTYEEMEDFFSGFSSVVIDRVVYHYGGDGTIHAFFVKAVR